MSDGADALTCRQNFVSTSEKRNTCDNLADKERAIKGPASQMPRDKIYS